MALRWCYELFSESVYSTAKKLDSVSIVWNWLGENYIEPLFR
jgi:hypothetical protein